MSDTFDSHVKDAEFVYVPITPTEEMWGNALVRSVMRWCSNDQPTLDKLFKDLKYVGVAAPKWLYDEAEMSANFHVVSKGTRAVIVYKAMLEGLKEKT